MPSQVARKITPASSSSSHIKRCWFDKTISAIFLVLTVVNVLLIGFYYQKKQVLIFFLIIIHSLSKQLYKAKFCSSWSFYSKWLFLFTIGSFASLASAHYPRVSVFMINIAPSYFSFILDKAIKHKYCTPKKILYLRCIYYYNEI